MKIRIKEKIPVANPPEIGSVHEVFKTEKIKKESIYFILHNRVQIGIYGRECEVIEDESKRIIEYNNVQRV
ncbi:MAG: hypothetical protein K6G85_07650 [Eubacterium sp.]|nr:hypothetical protein [Eubacterium sp.]